ncbi:hypothetical protein G6L63_20785 [Agrobacterium vitis]|uniref:DUF2236 domain-containing protein n=1 Tax=Agrobacterium vitis TaxID=373 RepID=A0A368NTT9_AGRVI|nr:hypothetical protein [Agrobacterium vitis]KAA3517627.1 hypothetical protein DXM22_07925 [Agrobacterium vitis]KAA3527028.1 hypothetical protein DXT89_13920 [Agrobacterium vitis]MCF1476944.1 hypothetical protein [Agrobacterium vitis]MUZ95872.1 hypothetical protein [Agrobacterium vitis]MVA29751.1 hypothetical protein [Agrobacterium vitis]
MNAPKKWIQNEIQSLDPEKDYVRIWRLSSSYGLNDFMQNFIYALTFPNFVVTEWGAEVVWRDDGGKVVDRATSRVEQTSSANALWWFYGPHDERTKKSAEGINNLHAYWAKKYPGRFSYTEDYIYTCAFTAITMHRLRLRMGLPGISEKEQIASHRFWLEMSKLFVAENNQPLHGYPEDFAGLISYCEAIEEMDRPKHERGNLIATAIYEQFVFRFFPKELHWLGHQLLRSMSLPTTLETMQIEPAYPMAQDVLPKLMGLIFWYLETQLDDPTESYIESRDKMSKDEKADIKAGIRALDQAFPEHYVSLYKDDPKFAGCPFHAGLQKYQPQGDVPSEIEAIEAQAGILG